MANGPEAEPEIPSTLVTRDLGRALVAVESVRRIGAAAQVASATWDEVDLEAHAASSWSELSGQDREGFGRTLFSVFDLIDAVPQDYDPMRKILSPEAQQEFYGGVDALLIFLPFSATERWWLVEEAHKAVKSGVDQLDHLAGCVDTVIASGQSQIVTGNELLQRWFDWIRNTGSFEVSGTQPEAAGTLDEIVREAGFGTRGDPKFQDYLDVYYKSQTTSAGEDPA